MSMTHGTAGRLVHVLVVTALPFSVGSGMRVIGRTPWIELRSGHSGPTQP